MLSVTSKYALRALTHLATLPEGETMLGKDLAKRAQITLPRLRWSVVRFWDKMLFRIENRLSGNLGTLERKF